MPRVSRQSARSRMENQRLRREAMRLREEAQSIRERAFTRGVEGFESSLRNIALEKCLKCLRRVEQSSLTRLHTCPSCHRTAESNFLFGQDNGMDLGLIPAELTDLTLVEQILIARVHPVVSVFKIRGQQRAYNGHVMNFVQRIDRLAIRLPHDPRTLSAIILLNRNTPNGLIQFRVRASKIVQALRWLQKNNIYYSDIVVDDRVISSLPNDGDISQLLPNADLDQEPGNNSIQHQDDGPSLSTSCYPNLPAINHDEVIERNIRRRLDANQAVEGEIDIGDWPEVEPDPLSEFTTEGIVCQAFPHLFPYGRGDLNCPRLRKITKHKYFKYLMAYHDGRFANDVRFPYYAYNSLARWDALNCGNVFVRHHNFQDISAQDMLEVFNNPNRNIASSIMYYGTNLRGTRPYWRQRSHELLQMCRQLGTPTIFFTLSAADYWWPDLFRVIRPEIDPITLSQAERRKIMNENPTIVAWFFERRVAIFFKQFLSKIFDINDHWFRYEWQHRGSPHVHGVLWLNGAPSRDDIDSLDEAGRSAIVDYFDQYISATKGSIHEITYRSHPCLKRYSDLTEDEKALDLDRILCAVQRHTICGDHCQRRNRISRQVECRFKFPIPTEERSCLRKEDGDWKFIPARNDSLLQRYNRYITSAWRGNTDCSAIVSRDAVLKYIAKYASKGENASPAFSEILQRLLGRSEPDTPASKLVRQLLISSVAERNFSAQEVMHLLMGYPLFHASRTFVVLSLENEWRRYGDTGANKILDAYSNRPVTFENLYLDNLSLYEFVKQFSVANNVRRRTKECIVIAMPFTKLTGDLSSDERHYRNMCKLYVPWRSDFEAMRNGYDTWRDTYNDKILNQDRDDPFAVDPEQNDIIGSYEDQSDHEADDIVRDAGHALARLQPTHNPAEPLGRRVIDEGHGWNDVESANVTESSIREFLQTYASSSMDLVRPGQGSDIRLSDSQREVLSICRSQIRDPQFSTKRVLVQGKAGTGKSLIIRELCHQLESSLGRQSFQVLAPTGQAASNVDGTTLHSFFKIPAQGEMMPLNGPSMREFALIFRDVRFIIIDEYSMIGLRLLAKIHKRLCEGTGCTQPFGGIFIYFFGDLRQLPPVLDAALYMPPVDSLTALGSSLIQQIDKIFVLSYCHRQMSDETNFVTALDNIACGRVTRTDWELLTTRRVFIVRDRDAFREAVHLFPTNEQVRLHNEERLRTNNQPVAIIEAICNNQTARIASSSNAQGLSNKLYLSIGCRIMLRRNICVKKGLVNGALGFVREILYQPGFRPPTPPLVILVEFDRYAGPYYQSEHHNQRLFPILPVTVSWKERGTDCFRRQFPISLAYALTIHKSQGLTLDKVAVDIGEKEIAPGATYVALSRCRRLHDLMLLSNVNFERLESIGRNRHIIERSRFLATRLCSN